MRFIYRAFFVCSFKFELLLAFVSVSARQRHSAQVSASSHWPCESVPFDRLYSAPVLVAHTILWFLVFFIVQPFLSGIFQDHEQCFFNGHQTDSGASEPGPAIFSQPDKSWMCRTETCFTLQSRWIVAHWIYQLILLEMTYIFVVTEMSKKCYCGREGDCSNNRDVSE